MYSWNMIFNILMVFDIKEKMDNFDPYVFLGIATNATYDCFFGPGSHLSFYF